MSNDFITSSNILKGMFGGSSSDTNFKEHVDNEKKINDSIKSAGEDDDSYPSDDSETLAEWNDKYVKALVERLETIYKFDKSNLQSMKLNLNSYKNAFDMSQSLRDEYASVYRDLYPKIQELVEDDISRDVAVKIAEKYRQTMLSFVESSAALTASYSQVLFNRNYQEIGQLAFVDWGDEETLGLPNVDVGMWKWSEHQDGIDKFDFRNEDLLDRVNGKEAYDIRLEPDMSRALSGLPKYEIFKRVDAYQKYEELYLRLISDYDDVISWSWDSLKQLRSSLFVNFLHRDTDKELEKISPEKAEDWRSEYQDWMEQSASNTIHLIQVNVVDTLSMLRAMHQRELENAFNAGGRLR